MSPRSWCQGHHPFACGGLSEADAVAGGGAEVGVVQEPVDGGTGEGFGHDLVEAAGVEVGAEGDAAFFVGGVDEAVEAFGAQMASTRVLRMAISIESPTVPKVQLPQWPYAATTAVHSAWISPRCC